MLTAEGLNALSTVVSGWLADAKLMVGDGRQRAEVPLDMEPFSFEDGVVTLTATFGEEVANFEWREQGVVVGGQLVDQQSIDGGRKILGASWTVEYALTLAPDPQE